VLVTFAFVLILEFSKHLHEREIYHGLWSQILMNKQ
jgi:hypothetical protein